MIPVDRQLVPVVTQRLSWEAMDQLKARMVREGYPLSDLTPQANEAIWKSLSGRIRRPELQVLVGMDDEQIDTVVRDLRGVRQEVTGRR